MAVIRRAELEFPTGLAAITGETGAGKTVLARALGLLAGGPADRDAVRPGSRAALAEAVLEPPPGFWDALEPDHPALAARELVDDEREVLVARRVPAEGRARALVEGQAVPREVVAALVGELVRFSAQGDARRLVTPAAQLAALDAFAGPEALSLAAQLASLRRRAAALDSELAAARSRAAAAERERGELESLVAELDAAGLDPFEEADLRAERERLLHADRLAGGAGAAAAAVSSEDGGAGALAAVGEALRAIEPLLPVDPALDEPRAELAAAEASLSEAALTLRAYIDGLDAEAGRLVVVEERLDVYVRLVRRHGGDVAALLARAAEAREVLQAIDQGQGEGARLAAERSAIAGEAHETAERLAELRAHAAPLLAQAAGGELAALAMPDAGISVRLADDHSVDPPRQACEIWLRANPGLPEAPLARVASGGELSRVLLALHAVGTREGAPAWVFDEIDAGIGGATASAVGDRLAAMAAGGQVLAITHLPQIAARADAHYRVAKGLDDAGAAVTTIERLAGDDLVDELCRMLGAGPEDAGARRHAEELLERRAA